MRRLAASLLCLLAISCGEQAGPADPPPSWKLDASPDLNVEPEPDMDQTQPGPPASIELEGPTSVLQLGDSQRLRVTIRDARGEELPELFRVAWSSDDEGVAVIDAPGDLLAVGPGVTTIRASIDALSASAQVRVRAGAPAMITIAPTQRTLKVGDRLVFFGTLLDASGMALQPALYDLQWSSSEPAIATVDARGEVVARSVGQALIALEVEGVRAESRLTVEAAEEPVPGVERVAITPPPEQLYVPGDALTLRAQALNAASAEVPDVMVRWTSSNLAVATIDDSGRLTFLAAGETTIRASVGAVSSELVLSVTWGADSVAAGEEHACVLINERPLCWGKNDRGQLGIGLASAFEAPRRLNVALRFVQMAAGGAHTCAIDREQRVQCWGANTSGQLGDGSITERRAPVMVGQLRARAICAGTSHSCAVTPAGELFCWGANGSGQLASAPGTSRHTPQRVPGNTIWSSVTCGRAHTCAFSATGATSCWGDNTSGQLADQTFTSRHTPSAIAGNFEMIALNSGHDHLCGNSQSGTPICWGKNDDGRLGEGTTLNRSAPTFVSAPETFIRMAPGARHSCAQAATGHVYCWGDASAHQLGALPASSTPARVMASPNAVWVAAGGDTTYIVDTKGEFWGWGQANAGQLGPTRSTMSAQPVRIFEP